MDKDIEIWGEPLPGVNDFSLKSKVDVFVKGINEAMKKDDKDKDCEIDKRLGEIFQKYKKGENVKSLMIAVAETLSPILNQKDPSWEEGAQIFLRGCMLAILENKNAKGLTLAKLKKITGLGNFDYERPAILREYFRTQSEECRQLVDAVVNNAEKTAMNFLGLVHQRLAKL